MAIAEGQMFESKSILERRLGIPIRHFAYPCGNRSCAGARKFKLAGRSLAAVTTLSGLNLRQLHAFASRFCQRTISKQDGVSIPPSGVPFLGMSTRFEFLPSRSDVDAALLSASDLLRAAR
jgi:hypothetical protein